MLHHLYLKNFALVGELTVNFGPGFNIITGETGAGKSILVNAISQLCGERSSTDYIRDGADRAVLEAQFTPPDRPEFKRLLAELEIEPAADGELIIRKEMSRTGAARTFVNDSPVTLQKLTRLSGALIDIHGQHQHQRLLHPENHIFYLDAFAGCDAQRTAFAELLKSYYQESSALKSLKQKQIDAFQQQDLFKYQSQELAQAELEENELDELRAELKVLSNVEVLHQLGGALGAALYDGEINVGSLLSDAERKLIDLEKLDEQFSGFAENLASARETVEEIGRFTEQYLSQLEFNPQRMEQIHQRIAQLEFLLKKYQCSDIAELIRLHEQMQQNILDTEQYDARIAEQQDKVEKLVGQIELAGSELHHKRTQAAGELSRRISELLAGMGMTQARLQVVCHLLPAMDAAFKVGEQSVQVSEKGFDDVVFEIASNRGETARPIHKIASGGEISRLMLALKTVLAGMDGISTLVFDEIDAGISGKVAQIVGSRIAGLATSHQILCVTHLPQIAAYASRHLKVEKYIEDERTFVDTKLLGKEQREKEIAALLGGSALTSQALENARQLIAEASSPV